MKQGDKQKKVGIYKKLGIKQIFGMKIIKTKHIHTPDCNHSGKPKIKGVNPCSFPSPPKDYLTDRKKICQFCEEPIKDEDLGGVFKLKGKTVFFHDFPQCLLALKIQLQMDDNTVEEVAFHLDLCERCGSNHKTKDCIKTTSTHLTTWNCIYCEKDGYDLTVEQIEEHMKTHKTNKLQELVDEIHKMSGIGKITLTERIQALLTSEVEKGKEEILSDLRKEYIRIQHVLDDEYGTGEQVPHYVGILENWIEEQRKALSDIKEEGKV